MKRVAVSRQAAALATPFTKIARAITKNHGIKVIPSSRGACTNGTVIMVPFAAELARGETLAHLHGMLDHEVGHVLVEEQAKLEGKVGFVERFTSARRRGDKKLATVMNCIEDLRIEKMMAERFPGSRENLENMNKRIVELRVEAKSKGKEESLWRQVTVGFIARAHGLDDSWLGDEARAFIDDERTKVCVEKVRTLESPTETEQLSREWIDSLKEIARERMKDRVASTDGKGVEPLFPEDIPPPPPGPGKTPSPKGEDKSGEDDEDELDAPDDEDEDELDDEDADGSPGDEGESSALSDDSDEAESDDDAEPRPLDESDEDEGPTELDEDPDFEDLRDELRKDIDDALTETARELGIFLPHPVVLEQDVWRQGTSGDYGRDPYALVKAEVQGQIGALRQRQLARIQTKARARLNVGLDDGDLDHPRLHEVALGSRDVYCEVNPGRKVSMAIQVLLDLSGSIGSGKCDYYMRRTLVALAESWEPIQGLSYDILGFHNFFNDGEFEDVKRSHGLDMGLQPDGVHYVRMPFEMIHFKQYQERIGAFRGRFAEVRAHEDNCDHEAVWMAAKRVAARPEQRKILCVINDGQPCCSYVPEQALQDGLRKTVKQITAAGIEVWGIGAGTDAPKQYYNERTGARNVVIKDLSTMAQTLLSLFSKRIEAVE